MKTRRTFLLCLLLAAAICMLYAWRESTAVAARGAGGGAPTSVNGDVNGDGNRDISDAIFLLSYLFSGGPAPVACAGGLDAEVTGLRVAAPDGSGRVVFGNNPDNLCSIGIDPPAGLPGLLLRDPAGIRILSPPNAAAVPRLIFGPTDDCSLGIDPTGRMGGLIESDPVGFRLLGRDQQGCRLIFGPTMDCTVEVDPEGPAGLLLRDPRGIRILPRAPGNPGEEPGVPRLIFGPTDDCSLGIDPTGQLGGLIESDPVGFRLLGREQQGCRLIFGPTMDCTVEVDPAGPPGLLLRDPRGIRILPPASNDPGGAPSSARIIFGPTDDCSLGIDPLEAGLRFRDPRGFFFEGGPVFASQFVQASSRRFKKDVQPIEDPLGKVARLQGVTFRWDEAHGGKADIGFVAEDVAKVLPEVVERESDGVTARGLDYGHIVAVAVEGIKAQQREIDSLRSRNDALERELGAMREQMAAIAARVDALTPAAPAAPRER